MSPQRRGTTTYHAFIRLTSGCSSLPADIDSEALVLLSSFLLLSASLSSASRFAWARFCSSCAAAAMALYCFCYFLEMGWDDELLCPLEGDGLMRKKALYSPVKIVQCYYDCLPFFLPVPVLINDVEDALVCPYEQLWLYDPALNDGVTPLPVTPTLFNCYCIEEVRELSGSLTELPSCFPDFT